MFGANDVFCTLKCKKSVYISDVETDGRFKEIINRCVCVSVLARDKIFSIRNSLKSNIYMITKARSGRCDCIAC